LRKSFRRIKKRLIFPLISKTISSVFLSVALAATGITPASTTPSVVKEEALAPKVECVDKECISNLITHYAKIYKVDPKYAIDIAKCESMLNPTAVGDGGLAYGVFQFHKPTFEMFAKKIGESLDYYKTEDNIKLAVWAFANDREFHWTCARKLAAVNF